jgi:hypothetical protein
VAQVERVDEALGVGEHLGVGRVAGALAVQQRRSTLPIPFWRSTQVSKLPPFPLARHLATRSIISWKCSACFISWRSVPSAPSLPWWNAFGPSMIAIRGSAPSALRGSSGRGRRPGRRRSRTRPCR